MQQNSNFLLICNFSSIHYPSSISICQTFYFILHRDCMKDLFQHDTIKYNAMGAFMGLREKSFRFAAAEEKEQEVPSAIVNDSPRILCYDNKRRRPLRKASSRYCELARLVRPDAVSVHLFIFIFLIPVTTLRGTTRREDGRRCGEASVDSPSKTNDSFRAGKFPGSRIRCLISCRSRWNPRVSRRENSSPLQNITSARFLETPRGPSRDIGEEFSVEHITALLLGPDYGKINSNSVDETNRYLHLIIN